MVKPRLATAGSGGPRKTSQRCNNGAGYWLGRYRGAPVLQRRAWHRLSVPKQRHFQQKTNLERDISNLNVHSIKPPPIVPQSPPVPLSSHPPSREHRNHVQNWSQSRIGFGLCLTQGPFALSAPSSATFSRNRNRQTDSDSVAKQVAPSARLPGIAQQRRALSIHEYISADLLNQVRILCASPARSSPSHSDPKKIVWHWRPQRLCREDGRRG